MMSMRLHDEGQVLRRDLDLGYDAVCAARWGVITMAACGGGSKRPEAAIQRRPRIVPTPASGARPPGDIYQIEVTTLGI